ncbi:WecB/TagA/CpsF family glycosyltransferase [Gracilimonas mengyeensis]|uniref:N-acetylglucosaminyldiphosphoundecaprenol N-acetyl-beta-D-mannosaminyltransferase n=1 Tax=Gracilimonas mengyeensis TaxID=1302730 RepID=A0A521FMM0_9BACT|nr:WecB/TagA/CpsF family glycosyltransferase [Gracilimonas mengyeensis]SMO96711.1 N-acetylglucosaminyldiphosphoundecaprenol N-acetyl-beta-D-mannosaminyltransferase [Gracilimonas mengyeensis]
MRLQDYQVYGGELSEIKKDKVLINTINAHSYNVSRKDALFTDSLKNCDVLIPDGISVVWALKWLNGTQLKKIAGADLFFYEMDRLQQQGGSCFFLGSTNETLKRIKNRAAEEYPDVTVGTYSPPYKPEFSEEDSAAMVQAVNEMQPDVLFIGLTAPKQEKWAYQHLDALETGHICCIGAVFDFYAGTITRAPQWMIDAGLEWLYRLVREPRRMWRRYLVGNVKFLWAVSREKFSK